MMQEQSNILIYENNEGNIHVDVVFKEKDLWLSQAQLCEVFGKAKATISEHISNILNEGELQEDSVVRLFRTTASDKKNYEVKYAKYKDEQKKLKKLESIKELENDIKKLK